MSNRYRLKCARALTVCLWGASVAAAAAGPTVLDKWKWAERADIDVLMLGRQNQQLDAYRSMQEVDLRLLNTELQPALRPMPNGWVNCAAARQALEKALGTVSTIAGLESIAVRGERIETLQCAGYPNGAGRWWGKMQAALFNVQGRLPAGFTKTRAAVAATRTSDLRAAAQVRAVNAAAAPCLSRVLTQARASNQNFQPAQRRAIETCLQ